MININNYSKKYGDKTVLKNINFNLQTGSILGLMGKNGAGKTSLIKSIIGEVEYHGNIKIENMEHKKFLDLKSNEIHFVPDSPHTYPYLTALEQIQFAIELRKKPFSHYRDEVYHLLELFDLADNANDLIKSYSFGMRRKVALVTALVLNPSILILDEPVLGLDTISIINFKKILREHYYKKRTVIYSTHVPELIRDMCDSILILHNNEAAYFSSSVLKNNIDIESKYLEIVSQ